MTKPKRMKARFEFACPGCGQEIYAEAEYTFPDPNAPARDLSIGLKKASCYGTRVKPVGQDSVKMTGRNKSTH